MSENDPKAKQVKVEVVEGDADETARESGLQGTGRGGFPVPSPATSIASVLSSLFQSPRREAKKAREWADAANAHAELDGALTELGRSRDRLRALPTILATDDEERQTDLARQRNLREEEERTGRMKALKEQLAEEDLRAQIAEARRRREQAEKPAPREPESALLRTLRSRIKNRAELLAERDQLIAAIKARSGADGLSEADEREIQNVEDAVQKILDNLD